MKVVAEADLGSMTTIFLNSRNHFRWSTILGTSTLWLTCVKLYGIGKPYLGACTRLCHFGDRLGICESGNLDVGLSSFLLSFAVSVTAIEWHMLSRFCGVSLPMCTWLWDRPTRERNMAFGGWESSLFVDMLKDFDPAEKWGRIDLQHGFLMCFPSASLKFYKMDL